MTFQWQEFLLLARALSQSSDEASLRSAISRAYYAAFRTARDVAVSRAWVRAERAGHKEVWDAFCKRGPRERRIGHLGESLQFQRQDADYEAPHPNAAKLTYASAFAIALAERVIREVDALPPDPDLRPDLRRSAQRA